MRILCIGDGNTAGYTDNPDWTIPFEFGYRSGLYLRMTTNGHPVQFVGDSSEPWSGFFGLPTNTPSPDLRLLGQDYHRGYAGLNTSHVLSYISNWLVVDDPDIILLLIGLDDPDINVTRSNLTHILQTIATNQPHASTIVAQIPPLAYYTQIIVDLNNFIRDTLVPAFQAQGNRVGTVDQYAHLLTGGVIDPSLFANQLNHPGNMAFDHMAQTWYVGIQAALTAPSLVRFTRVSSSGGNLVLAGSGGPADTRFHMLTSTNPALPASSWQTNSPMGTFDSAGNFTYTNALNLNRPGRFFRIKSQ